MAVNDSVQGLGIGQKLLEHCLKIAEQKGIKKLLLYSNRKLLPAIYLYIKFGFQEVPLEDGVYERADIKMEKIIY
jgi:ribosomal protein S18 acetylase RimI-like enzyme